MRDRFSRVNWKSVWPLIDFATGIIGFALLIVGDLRGNRPLRALDLLLIVLAVMAIFAHLWSRGGGKAPPTGNAMTSRVGLGCQGTPELLEHNASQEDTRGGNSEDSTPPASPVTGFKIKAA